MRFKSLEFGWVAKREKVFLNNAHVTLWQVDERKRTGTPDGWGISASITKSTDNGFMPFLRSGWADDGDSFYEASVSTGFSYTPNPGQSMLGVGLNWNRPNRATFGRISTTNIPSSSSNSFSSPRESKSLQVSS